MPPHASRRVEVLTTVYCAVMREIVAINTNFSCLVAAQVQDITFILTEQQRSGTTYLLILLTLLVLTVLNVLLVQRFQLNTVKCISSNIAHSFITTIDFTIYFSGMLVAKCCPLSFIF